eukprot:2399057-Ditylum_brightwellii.AAC.2
MGLVVWVAFLKVTLQSILEYLDLVDELDLVVPITNALTIIIDPHFIPIRAEVDILWINIPDWVHANLLQ